MTEPQISGLSIILPVIDERKNLEVLIPELLAVCSNIDVEIIVSDDSSVDGTKNFINQLNMTDKRISHIDRSGLSQSLPDSINDGISIAIYDHVLWMDADGSMPASVIPDLIQQFNRGLEKKHIVVVGSRFVPGGGFKGANLSEKTSLKQARKNLRETNDSFTAMILSRLLNRYLWLTLGRCCKDPASGFVLTNRSYFSGRHLKGSYGDYCPRFLFDAHTHGSLIYEVPYVCIPRQFGTSKTGETLFQLIRRGFPYLLVPARIRLFQDS